LRDKILGYICYKPKKHYGGKKLGLDLTKLINKDIKN